MKNPMCIGLCLLLIVAASGACKKDSEAQSETVAQQDEVDLLIDQLGNEDIAEQLEAAHQIGLLGAQGAAAVEPLANQLSSDSVELSIACAFALARIGPAAHDTIPAIIERMGLPLFIENRAPAALEYSRAIALFGEAAVPHLIEALKSENMEIRKGACESLHEIGPKAADSIPIMMEFITSDERQMVWAAAYVMEGVGPGAEPGVPRLIELLDDEDFQIQVIAMKALASIGQASKPAAPKLLELLEGGSLSVRSMAALTLGSIGPFDDIDIVSILLPYTTDFYDPMRERSLAGLGRLGSAAESALPHLESLCDDDSYRNRPHAAQAMWLISGNAAPSLEVLLEMVDDLSQGLIAIQAIGRMGPDASPATSRLMELLSSEDLDVRFETVLALERIGPGAHESITPLQELTEHPDRELASAAAIAIQVIQGER